MKRWLVGVLVWASCGAPPELGLSIRLPADRSLLRALTRLDLSAERDGRLLAQASFGADARYVSVAGVSHGPRTVLSLEGATESGDVIGLGRTCPIDFEQPGTRADLYFAPTNFFAPTAGPPVAERMSPSALQLAGGAVLIAGGDDQGAPLASAEVFAPGSATFAAASATLTIPRERAELLEIPSLGALITGGVDAQEQPIDTTELYQASLGRFVSLPNDMRLQGRVGHRMVALPDGRVLVTGGRSSAAEALASTVLLRLGSDGTAAIAPGPPLVEARRDHASVVAVGVPLIIGGFGGDGAPIATLEALEPGSEGVPAAFSTVATLRVPRADATATLLADGSILVVGGAGDAAGTPRADAELYNPITRTTTLFSLAAARRAHTASLLSDGRVLIIGGLGADGNPLGSVELFATGIGFVSERGLGTPRAGHVAVPLCDGTVLVVGGGAGAEIYTPPAT